MGGGDVKMMAAVGALLGVRLAVHAVLYAVLAGGVLAIVFAWRAGELGRALRNVGGWVRGLGRARGERPALGAGSKIELPYGVAIAIGALATLAREHWPG